MSRHPIETLWREHDLPEWFLGNGGTNTKLYALYDAIVEECAKWHEHRAELETNSLHCGDNSGTIAGAHRVAAFHRFSARELRTSLSRPQRAEGQ